MTYYTPKPEDLYIGYECEIWWNQNMLPENDWCPVQVLTGDTEEFDLYNFTSRIKEEQIRTPYLTKEQIEAEGWRQIHWREYLKETKKGTIHFYNGNKESEDDTAYASQFTKHHGKSLYEGDCPSINEFRKISKLLGI